jgi:electron transfer flavoprotein alpha subunit
VRVLVYATQPGQLRGLAGLVSELDASEAFALTAGPRGEVEKHTYSVFSRVYAVEAERLTPGQLAELLEGLYAEHQPDLVVGAAVKDATDAGSRLAARQGLPMFTEALSVEVADSGLRVRRQVLGGRAVAVLEAGLPALVTVKPQLWEEKAPAETGAEASALKPPAAVVEEETWEPKKREAVDLETAEIVVGVGRGFRKKEDLALAEELAELLGGVVAASRPIVADYGWLSEDRWIGISGKRIRPKLYIAIGISGAPQHMAAAMDSKIIIAINKDKNAPIFQYADYGVVADLYQFLPVLIKKLRERLGK